MRPLTANISKNALQYNIQKLHNMAKQQKLCLVVKANAYGHHVEGLISELNQADYLAVACVEEALQLKQYQARPAIILLEGVFEISEYQLCQTHQFEAVIAHSHQLEMLESYLDHPNTHNIPHHRLKIWIKVDTGMNRLGIQAQELPHMIQRLQALTPNIQEINLISHFACADSKDHSLNQKQIQLFNSITHPDITRRSLCNSAGLLHFNDQNTQICHDVLRSGLITYGVSPTTDKTGSTLGFKPVMTLTTKIISLKQVPKGETIGYGGIFTTQIDSKIAIIAVGYADGYPREISSEAYVLINRQKAPIVGRISMDMMAINVSDLSAVNIGDEVTLFGDRLPIEQLAKWANTIPYTLLTRIASRVHFNFTP